MDQYRATIDILNHRSIRTTQLYAKTAEKQVDEAGARTSALA
jgi:site-specific recombinase XerD